MTVVGVVPAAGRATRLQPLPCSKEMVDVGGRPVIEYVVERMRAVGPEEIRVVTRPDKEDVAAHAHLLGATVILAEPATAAESFAIGIDDLAPDDTVLLGFPDTVWQPPDGFPQLVHALDAAEVALGVFESDEPERSDVVTLEGDRVSSVDVKPEDPDTNLIWGCAAARVSALASLARHEELGHLFAELAGKGHVRAVPFPGTMVDIGTNAALSRARALLGA
ncbi:MAG: NTP transferase domain-containing protein [Actinobacteria bacterium]|nr:NTP transferase domain-containing protein [Actinomycetota bacterium]